MRRELPPAPLWPQGTTLDPGEDQQRTIAVRVAGVAIAQAAGMDAGLANIYDIIYWFPESNAKAGQK